jgi:hypothetical protein
LWSDSGTKKFGRAFFGEKWEPDMPCYMRVLFGFLILLFFCQKESATTPKRIFEKIYPYSSFVAQA